ncbi:glyoxylate/hydroxypyruvate reductase A [Gammaproteobacteria bacterium]|nr:glyoxylate/hydroxypyruvate reductase A [Gammaproteobacteria bacterium]
MSAIAFISRSDINVQSRWVDLLKSKLTNETILTLDQIKKEQYADIDIAIVENPDPAALARFSNLVWVQSLWVGVDSLIGESALKSIKLVKLIDPQMSKIMAEAVLTWTLYLQRNIPEYSQQQTNRQWRQLPAITSDTLRIGVLGAGALGLAAIKMLSKLDYQLSCWSRTPNKLKTAKNFTGLSGLQTMLKNTDILINLLPLTKQTYHLLDIELLSQLPVGAKLMNFSRGAVIDTEALLKLLKTQHISHAVLDVFEHEPLPAEDPIWLNPNITVLPHITAPTNMSTAADVAANNIKMYRETKVIPAFVDTELGY